MATCLALDEPGFTGQCSLPTAGSLTAQFEQIVNAQIDQAIAAGVQLCPEGQLFTSNITPCDVGITPDLLEEPGATCKLAPAGCHL